jgi:hypothetical protein
MWFSPSFNKTLCKLLAVNNGYTNSSTVIRNQYFNCDLKLLLWSEYKILFFGLFANVNLILSDDVSEPTLIPFSGQSRMYVGKQAFKVFIGGGQVKGTNESVNIRTNGRVSIMSKRSVGVTTNGSRVLRY